MGLERAQRKKPQRNVVLTIEQKVGAVKDLESVVWDWDDLRNSDQKKQSADQDRSNPQEKLQEWQQLAEHGFEIHRRAERYYVSMVQLGPTRVIVVKVFPFRSQALWPQ